MIYEIFLFLAGVLVGIFVGLYSAWLLGGRGIENIQDWYDYKYLKK